MSVTQQLTFPRWANQVRSVVGLLFVLGPLYALGLVYFGGAPRTTNVGYMPAQPVPFSHAQHVGQLGMDCRYCHLFVDRAAHASIPTTESCMNCHRAIWATSPKLLLVRESLTTGKSIEWWRVHDLPDYAYFDHSAHVARGVGCVSCHGRVDQMAEVWQDLSLSMSFCLACHRSPEQHLRPPDQVTSMDWQAPNGDPIAHGMVLRDRAGINPSTDCSTCHR